MNTLSRSEFFLSCPIGFEPSAEVEFREIWPFLVGKDARKNLASLPILEIKTGGLEFSCSDSLAYQLQFFHKTSSRLLQRIHQRKLTGFPELFAELKKLNWKALFFQIPNLQFKISCHQSRLGNEKRILEVFAEAWQLKEISGQGLQRVFSAGTQTSQIMQTVFVRFQNDVCTISLDASGNHLHERGYKTMTVAAPLRENVAAYLLRELTQDIPIVRLQKSCLLDSFSGSGTFSFEAMTQLQGNFQRSYSFQNWKTCPALFRKGSFHHNFEKPAPLFQQCIGLDQDEKSVVCANQNLELFKNYFSDKNNSIQFIKTAFQDFTLPENIPQEKFVIANPPFGERLKRQSIEKDWKAFLTKVSPRRAGILDLSRSIHLWHWPENYSVYKKIHLRHGGLDCVFEIREITQNLAAKSHPPNFHQRNSDLTESPFFQDIL